jgi:uncharacterized membrane protein
MRTLLTPFVSDMAYWLHPDSDWKPVNRGRQVILVIAAFPVAFVVAVAFAVVAAIVAVAFAAVVVLLVVASAVEAAFPDGFALAVLVAVAVDFEVGFAMRKAYSDQYTALQLVQLLL